LFNRSSVGDDYYIAAATPSRSRCFGRYASEEYMSPESMERLQKILQQKILQQTLEVFEWRGPKQHGPSA